MVRINSIFLFLIVFYSCIPNRSLKQNNPSVQNMVVGPEEKKRTPLPVIDLDSLDKVNHETIMLAGDQINRAFVMLKDGDSTLHLTANLRQKHRIFGYAKPDITAERLLLISTFKDEVENNPFHCRLGAYYEIGGMKNLALKFRNRTGEFVEVQATDSTHHRLLLYFEKNWVDLQ